MPLIMGGGEAWFPPWTTLWAAPASPPGAAPGSPACRGGDIQPRAPSSKHLPAGTGVSDCNKLCPAHLHAAHLHAAHLLHAARSHPMQPPLGSVCPPALEQSLTKDLAVPGAAQILNRFPSPKGQWRATGQPGPAPYQVMSTVRSRHPQAQAAGKGRANASPAAGRPGGARRPSPPPAAAAPSQPGQNLLLSGAASLHNELLRCSSTVSAWRLGGPSLRTPEAGLTHVRGD